MADAEPLEPAPRGHCGGRKYKLSQTEIQQIHEW